MAQLRPRELTSRYHTDIPTSTSHTGNLPAVSQLTTGCSQPGSKPTTDLPFDDTTSIRTAPPPSPRPQLGQSVAPSCMEVLENSGPHTRLRRRGVDPSSQLVFSKDSRTTKGDTWSMLSDRSLGGRPTSEVSVLELPTGLPDPCDPALYVYVGTPILKYGQTIHLNSTHCVHVEEIPDEWNYSPIVWYV